MQLYLIRHADAAPGQPDSDRPLTPKGINTTKKLAAWMKRSNISQPDELRYSTLKRARQTAELLYREMAWTCPLREVPLLQPCDDFRITADLLNQEKNKLMLVGHNPHLSMLASYLLIRDAYKNLFRLKKNGVIFLKKDTPLLQDSETQNPWSCHWVLSPKVFKN